MKSILFNLFAANALAENIESKCDLEHGEFILHKFPDAETYIKINSDVHQRNVIILTQLNDPDKKILSLLFMAETLKQLGATRIGLVTPYLPYMRQDIAFHPGEGITSNYFAKLLSSYFDWLVTVDPHLHRHHKLSEIYSIPTRLIPAATAIAGWIKLQVKKGILIGPDQESKQWVAEIAKIANAPYLVLEKVRYADREVKITFPDLHFYQHHQPILVDDIISTGHTMMSTIQHLEQMKFSAPICIGVHAIFAANAYEQLLEMGVKTIITCNTITHASNQIDLSDGLCDGIMNILS